MILQCKLPECVLDCLVVGIARNAQHLVEISLGNFGDGAPPEKLSGLSELRIHNFFLRGLRGTCFGSGGTLSRCGLRIQG